jgi:hypothetical protein
MMGFETAAHSRRTQLFDNWSRVVASYLVIRRGPARVALLEWGDELQRFVPLKVFVMGSKEKPPFTQGFERSPTPNAGLLRPHRHRTTCVKLAIC